jgi:hypothetical protein
MADNDQQPSPSPEETAGAGAPACAGTTRRSRATAEAGVNRRRFLGGMGGVAVVAAGATAAVLSPLLGRSGAAGAAQTPDDAAGPGAADSPDATASTTAAASRRAAAYRVRTAAARDEFQRVPPAQATNGDEQRYKNLIGSYSKGLPHNAFGEVDAAAWNSMIKALASGDPKDFEAIVLGGGKPLTDPQSGLAFDLEGADTFALTAPPPPALGSAEVAGEMVELYWMSLLRDVGFADYATSPDAAAACADLNALSDFKGPRLNGQVTPQTLFRDVLPGATAGPYFSQFMWLPTPFGAEFVDRQLRTFQPGSDHMTEFDDWLTVQDGGLPAGSNQFDPQRRYLRCGRDIASWVHMDVLYQAYFNACLLLLTPPNAADAESSGLGCPLNPTNPYNDSKTQTGFGTFGAPGIIGLVAEVASRALKTTWRQKWFVHRRLRPEACGGLVHLQKTANRYPGVLSNEILQAPVLDRVSSRFNSFLHPQAFPEGCPTHPSYTAGHATVAGACVTVLKALFDETFVLQNPVMASADGLSLVPYTGGASLTVGGELNKLASNIATGRNIAGVHWRSDAFASLRLGEQVAIALLRDTKPTYNESRDGFFSGFSFTSFDGNSVVI